MDLDVWQNNLANYPLYHISANLRAKSCSLEKKNIILLCLIQIIELKGPTFHLHSTYFLMNTLTSLV